MSVNNEIIEKIPLLIQGKLNSAEAEGVRAEIAGSPQLQAELNFWQGVYSIRNSMPRLDFSDHPSPESLDRFALGRVNSLSSEYSEISSHLQQCGSCTKDIELLRAVAQQLPDEQVEASIVAEKNWLSAVIESKFISRLVVPIAAVLIVVFVAVIMLNKPGEEPFSVRVALSMQFEKRAIADEGLIPEMHVALQKDTRELIFAFPTDRVEIPEYSYDIDLNRRGGETLALRNQELECKQTELLNQCELKVTDQIILNTLKEGGSFSLLIREEFPSGVTLVPAEYEFYFNVSVED